MWAVFYTILTLHRKLKKLKRFVAPVKSWKKRNLYKDLYAYVYEEIYDKVFILYGLRRTGKTTLMRQVISEMDEQMFQQTAFIQISEKNIWDELYDRCFLCHTTFIPYHEFEDVLGIKGIDEYIRYSGTMSISGNTYNMSTSFETKAKTNAYVDSAIAHNIQHSLKYYQYGTHFRSSGELYEKNELTNVINRVVEDINHRFAIEVLTREFKSSDLSISAKNLRRDREKPTDNLSQIDTENVTKRLMDLLEIKNKEDQSVEIKEAHRVEIKEYLDLLDLTLDIEKRKIPHSNQIETRTIITQPGLRYAQVEALITSLLKDEKFNEMHPKDKAFVVNHIMNEVKGRMMEDIILLETQMARRSCEVFQLQFAIGEYDMVVFDVEKCCCEIYEIKHSTEVVSEQRRHLLDEKKLRDTAFRYGDIVGKYIIYQGEEMEVDGVKYLNVENYLNGKFNLTKH